jgi:hypothetical protein
MREKCQQINHFFVVGVTVVFTMRHGIAASVLAFSVAGTAVYTFRGAAPAGSRDTVLPPAVVFLENTVGDTHTTVMLRRAATSTQPVSLGVISHVAGSALRGAVDPTALRVYVVAAETESRHGSTYNSALWRVQPGGVPTRLLGGITDASRPIVTRRANVLVQRGRDGEHPTVDDHILHERIDDLTLDTLDPTNGTSRTLWNGRGLIAYPATALDGDEVLIYHVAATQASLFALNTVTAATRTLLPSMNTPARDFSYNASLGEITFARVSLRDAQQWEIVTVSARRETTRTQDIKIRWRTTNDHLMPRVTRDSTVFFSLPEDRGLGLLLEGALMPSREAPMGNGTDEVLDESSDGRWLAVRHRSTQREMFGLYDRTAHRVVTLQRDDIYTEFAGFVNTVIP